MAKKLERFENQTLEDLYAAVAELRQQALAVRAQTKKLNEEIARREAEAALARRAGRGQTIGEPQG